MFSLLWCFKFAFSVSFHRLVAPKFMLGILRFQIWRVNMRMACLLCAFAVCWIQIENFSDLVGPYWFSKVVPLFSRGKAREFCKSGECWFHLFDKRWCQPEHSVCIVITLVLSTDHASLGRESRDRVAFGCKRFQNFSRFICVHFAKCANCSKVGLILKHFTGEISCKLVRSWWGGKSKKEKKHRKNRLLLV